MIDAADFIELGGNRFLQTLAAVNRDIFKNAEHDGKKNDDRNHDNTSERNRSHWRK